MKFFSGSVLLAFVLAGCGSPAGPPTLTIASSAVGAEGTVLRRQLARFQDLHPDRRVEIRTTPDAADIRHQLYVQWLNAHASEPDVLQVDVIWTPEFAAAGWILPLDRFGPDPQQFFAAAIAANRWRGQLFALPWFVDVGMLYWRTDLVDGPPVTLSDLQREAEARTVPYGVVWQGARYEGLVTVFLEYLGAFGGRILDEQGSVIVDSEAAIRALEFMCDSVGPWRIVPRDALGWQEEQTRFAFQNGEALFMRNWPYAFALMNDPAQSKVAGRFAVASMPAAAGGRPTAALGGSQLAINARSRHPESAYELIQFLLAAPQMIERAQVAGQYPSRPALYDASELAAALGVDPGSVRDIIEQAQPRPVTPVYSELSELLQIRLHRALTGQEEPRAALIGAAAEMRRVLRRAELADD